MQLVTSNSIKFFDKAMREKYMFVDYTDKLAPTLFFGIYSQSDLKRLKRHNGQKLVLLNGSDSMRHQNLLEIIDTGAHIISGSKWVSEDLIAVGCNDFHYIPFLLSDIYDWKQTPLGDSLYWYGGTQTKYGKKYVSAVRQAYPDLDIIFLDSNSVPKSEMADIYSKCFAGIRIVDHDGSCQTASELGLMGRKTIWNGNTPFSVPYDNTDDIIKSIGELRKKEYNPSMVAHATKNFYLRAERSWCDLILMLFGTKEVDVTGIMEEAIGRCGSIFRIQRRDDIEVIGGMGDAQFERPWFSDKMQVLGKRQLITSKNQGFIASEWKGGHNKGYPDGLKPRTYDKKYS